MVLKILAGQLSVTEAAATYGISRRQLHRLLARARTDGIGAVDPKSRRPLSNPASTPEPVRARIIELRQHLTANGMDAGPVTIAWHLEQQGHRAPSTSTIRRILHTAGLVTPEPRKRPKNSFVRFEASQPNETWQSDFTHWRLADGTDIEILNWLDDHSRYLLACQAFPRVTGDNVVTVFLDLVDAYGTPASTLTDIQGLSDKRCVGSGGFHQWVVLLSRPAKVIANALSAGFHLIAQRALPPPVGSSDRVTRYKHLIAAASFGKCPLARTARR